VRNARCLGVATALSLALATTGPASAGSAAPAPAALVASPQRAPLDLTVAGVHRGIVIVLVFEDDIWLPVDALHEAEITFPASAVHSLGGASYVSLRALAPAVTYTYNSADLSLDVRIANASALASSGTEVNLSSARSQTQLPNAVTSGFLSYDVTESLAQLSPSQLGGFFDAGFSNNTGRFDATNDVDSTGFHRGLYAFTFDNESNMSTFAVGDYQAPTSNQLSSTFVIGGLSVSRNFNLQPDFIRNPTPTFSGTALSPTEADIYVNGVLYRTVQLQPGPFQLQNLNLPVGSNVTQVVLHDAYGNVTQFGTVFYGAQEILAKGVSDYDYQLGFVRLNPFGVDDVYGPLAAVSAYRFGFTNALTAGGAFEASQGIVDGGPSLSARMPIGQVDLAAAFSDARGIDGQAEGATYSFVAGRFSAQAAVLFRSNDYATIALPITSDRSTAATYESFGYRLSPFVDLDLSHTDTHNRDSGPADQLTSAVRFRTAGQESWTVSLARNRGSFFTLNELPASTGVGALNENGPEQSTWTVGVAAALNVGRTGYLQAQTSDNAGQTTTAVSYTKSAANSPGQLGYSATAQLGGGQSSFFEDAQYNANHFDVQEQVTDAAGGSSAIVGLSGALAFFKQGIFFTRPLQNAYGLVDVSGQAGFPVLLSGVMQGTTDNRGYIVIPNMTPYIDNRVELGGLERTTEFQADATEKIVVPRNESAGAVDFSVSKVQLFVGTLVVRYGAKAFPPRYGVLELLGPRGTSVSSDIGENGEFFFESLKPGKYRGTITYDAQGPCSFDLIVPTSNDFKVDLGAQTCVER
jgi:outer membrane usher protein